MSAFVCMHNITFSCIVDLWEKHQKINNRDLFCQWLYLLNVESVNQRYMLRGSADEEDRKEYQSYISHLADIRYEPHPELHDCQRMKQASCWLYQSCEGDCEEEALYQAVQKVEKLEYLRLASEIAGEKILDDDKAFDIVLTFAKQNNIDMSRMWGGDL